MTSEQESASALDKQAGVGPPPLRIHHFLVWTAVSAALLVLFGPLPQLNPAQPRLYAIVLLGWEMVNPLLVAGAVTLSLLGLVWRRTGRAYFDQPGHWLALTIAASGLAHLNDNAIVTRWFAGTSTGQLRPLVAFGVLLFELVALLFLGGFNFLIGWRKSPQAPWQWVFYWKAGLAVAARSSLPMVLPVMVGPRLAAMWYGGNWRPAVFALGAAGATALLLVAIVADNQAGRRRGWTHACGVGLQLAMYGLYLVVISVWLATT